MQPGEVRGPVQTDFGWHVLQLRELKQGEQVDFEQVREELAREQAQADRERAFSELTGRLTDLVYQNPSSLAPAAAARRPQPPPYEFFFSSRRRHTR